MSMVVKRFWDGGMTAEQVAERMDVPLDYVKECLERCAEGPEFGGAGRSKRKIVTGLS